MSLPRRVLYVRQAPYPWDVRVEKICRALQRHGCEVEILARRGENQPESADCNGIRVRRVGPQRPRAVSLPLPGNPLWYRAVLARVRAFRPDLLIARDIPVALFTARAARATRIPWVLDMAEHYPEAMRSWKKYRTNPLLRALVGPLRVPDRIERRAIREADGILPVCEEMKQRLQREFDFPPECIAPVLNTPEKARFANVRERQRGLRRWRFGYHGVLAEDRDLTTLLRGFDLAAARNPDIELEIHGDGESMPALKALRERLPSRTRIHLRGPYTPDRLESLYADVDFGVVSLAVNAFTQVTLPNKLFDYAACGRPFVFTATQPSLRLMRDMRCGVAYRDGEPADVARAILEITQADYQALAANGRDAVQRTFNWENDSARMLGLLEQVMDAQICAASGSVPA
ncbi:MAG TPA: glycosyltransferase family 4 protein [Rhodanobacteraceae bacterium]|nr:glycosyltransferase family 4 protein [Rhodanobacteraceae bacterium]